MTTKLNKIIKSYKKDLSINKYIYIMAIPVIVFYIVFHYMPMYGVVLAFKDFSPKLGIMGSKWAGLKHFYAFFTNIYSWRLIKNTLLISVFSLLWGFPMPIILSMLLNEVRNLHFKKAVQTLTYVPHFISLVVVCGMILEFTGTDGLINDIVASLGGERQNFMANPDYFRSVYIISGIWQGIGWGSIIYIAAIAGIDPSLYESAYMDGAGRLKQAIYITLPCIAPTIIILLILNVGRLMSVGFEKIILLYNPLTYSKSDVIASFVYRKGLLDADYSFSAAVGLFNSVINLTLLVAANTVSRKLSDSSLW